MKLTKLLIYYESDIMPKNHQNFFLQILCLDIIYLIAFSYFANRTPTSKFLHSGLHSENESTNKIETVHYYLIKK